MAVLEAPVDTTSTVGAPAATRPRKRRPRGPMPLPMIGLGLMVVFAVGFGAGSVSQFDTDWRTGSPHVVEATSGQAAPGASLGAVVTTLLADQPVPAHSVVCGLSPTAAGGAGTTSARVAGSGLLAPQTQLCRAQTSLGMVTIVTQTTGDQVDVTVFNAAG